MTGLELLVKSGDDLILFKVRHDGYAIDDFMQLFPKKNKIFQLTSRQFMDKFIDWYFDPTNYGPPSSSDIDTMFPRGFSFKDTRHMMNSYEYFVHAEQQLENLEKSGKILTPGNQTMDGFQCSYQDFMLFIDWDTQTILTDENIKGEDFYE